MKSFVTINSWRHMKFSIAVKKNARWLMKNERCLVDVSAVCEVNKHIAWHSWHSMFSWRSSWLTITYDHFTLSLTIVRLSVKCHRHGLWLPAEHWCSWNAMCLLTSHTALTSTKQTFVLHEHCILFHSCNFMCLQLIVTKLFNSWWMILHIISCFCLHNVVSWFRILTSETYIIYY